MRFFFLSVYDRQNNQCSSICTKNAYFILVIHVQQHAPTTTSGVGLDLVTIPEMSWTNSCPPANAIRILPKSEVAKQDVKVSNYVC